MSTLQGLKKYTQWSAPSYALNFFHKFYVCFSIQLLYVFQKFGCLMFDGLEVIARIVCTKNFGYKKKEKLPV